MASAEQRARDVCARITMLADWRDREEFIAQAIREAEDEAMDRAAAHIEQFALAISGASAMLPGLETVIERLAEMVSKTIPQEVRSLKHRDAA